MNLKVIVGAGLLMLVSSGCGQTITGKVPLVDGKLPPFFKVGETMPADVLERFGEPLIYREYNSRSVMIYEYSNLVFAVMPLDLGSYRIFLAFENNVLKKTEVEKLGWKVQPMWKAE